MPTLVFGVIEQCGAAYFNTAVVVRHGMLEGFYRKTHLVPGERLFQAGNGYPIDLVFSPKAYSAYEKYRQ